MKMLDVLRCADWPERRLPSLLGNSMMLGVGAGAETQYQIARSLRFNNPDSAYLSRTFAVAGNRKTLTVAFWAKRAQSGSFRCLYNADQSASIYCGINFDSNDNIVVHESHTGDSAVEWSLTTARVFRDPTAWMHICLAIDTTQTTAANRVKLYINGVQETSFSSATYPALSLDTAFNSTTAIHYFGRNVNGHYFDGYIAEFIAIDGQALGPFSFGAIDPATGAWNPKRYIGSGDIPTGYGSDETSGGTILYSTQHASYLADYAFDNTDDSNVWGPESYGPTPTNSFIGYDFGSAKHVRKITISGPAVYAGHQMTNCAVEYSSDGSNWTTLQNISMTAYTGAAQEFHLNPSQAYRYWRVRGLDTNPAGGSSYRWVIGEIRMFTATGTNSYGVNGFCLPFAANGTAAELGADWRGADPFLAQDADTKLLLAGVGPNGYGSFVDWSRGRKALTNVSSVTHSTAAVKFGPSSIYFNGSNYLTVPHSTDWDFGSGDFTVDFWLNTANIPPEMTVREIMGTSARNGQPGNGGWLFWQDNVNGLPAGDIFFETKFGGSGTYISFGAPTTGAWEHFAVVRSGNTLTAYRGGVQRSQQAISGSMTYTVSNALRIGTAYTGSPYGPFHGYLDQVRVSKGVARWTSGFTPPTSPYVSQNYWAPYNFSVAAGAGNDSLTDTPTNYGIGTSGGDLRGNFATLNPLEPAAGSGVRIFANGNLEASVASGHHYFFCTFNGKVRAGKWWIYVEFPAVSSSDYYGAYPTVACQNTLIDLNSPIANNDRFLFAVDLDAGKLWLNKNGTWLGGGDPEAGTNPYGTFAANAPLHFNVRHANQGAGQTKSIHNFGQRPCEITPPAGFKPLCAQYLPTPTIKKPSSHFGIVTRTGTGAAASITELGFSPDLVWSKVRTDTFTHRIQDTARGATNTLFSNTTGAEQVDANGLDAFTSDGYTMSVGTSAGWNTSAEDYVNWCWDEGAAPGFDIVTYTGDGTANRNIGHDLGVAPKFAILKRRDNASSWWTWHAGLTDATHFVDLQTTAAQTNASSPWGTGNWSSSQFMVSQGGNNINVNTATYVAYLWAEVAGFSKFGSYTGNGSADGPFVSCGFRPAYVMVKRIDSTNDWRVFDSARAPHNVTLATLYPDLPIAESSVDESIDFVAPGFKWRSAGAGVNANAGTYIFAAFAEHPFKYARAR